MRTICAILAGLALIAMLGCDINREARLARAESAALRADIQLLRGEIDRLKAEVALKEGLASTDAGVSYLTLDFFLNDFFVKPVGARAEIGEFLGVQRGVISVCHGGGFGGYSYGRAPAGANFLGSGGVYMVQTSRPIKANGVVGNASWVLHPAEDGEEGYCERVR